MSFDESIVVELILGRKKIFFTILYASNYTSPEFQAFLSNFKNWKLKIKAECPIATNFTGDFNEHSQFWWSDDGTTPEGRIIADIFTSLGLPQINTEPTDFEPNFNPSCIDLVVTDQLNLILDSGTRASLDSYCHHQIIHCKVNIRIPAPSPFNKKVWHFHRANSAAIERSMKMFPWQEHLNLNADPN